MGKFDFLPRTEQEKKLDDPAVKNAIRTLIAKGITVRQFEEVFKYFDKLKRNKPMLDHQVTQRLEEKK